MNLKELIKEVERLKQERRGFKFASKEWYIADYALYKMKQTVEAVDKEILVLSIDGEKDWQKLKKVWGIK